MQHPCWSALVITLLQKYKFPQPQAFTNKSQTGKTIEVIFHLQKIHLSLATAGIQRLIFIQTLICTYFGKRSLSSSVKGKTREVWRNTHTALSQSDCLLVVQESAICCIAYSCTTTATFSNTL